MKRNAKINVASQWYIKMAHIGAWYVGISIITWVSVLFILNLQEIVFDWSAYAFRSSITGMFFLVLGIVLPLVYTEMYITAGVTRRQLGSGMLIAFAGISASAALIYSIVYFIFDLLGYSYMDMKLIPVQMAVDGVLFMFCLLAGLVIAIGFLYARVYTMVCGIVFSTWCMIAAGAFFSKPVVWNISDTKMSVFVGVGLFALFTFIIAVIVMKIMKRLPVK